jgi:pilus assembly protein CpaF
VIRQELLARLRAEVASGLDAAAMLSAYTDPPRRLVLHERIRSAANVALSDVEVASLAAELFGFGVLQPLLDDPLITDVLVNTADEVYVDRAGRLERTGVRFESVAQVTELAHRIAAGVGRELTLERPYVDARMRDGSRANAVIAPMGGPTISIRKFSRLSLPLRGDGASWTASGGLADDAADLLARAVRARANMLIVGATAAGKSTLLRSLAAEIPPDERIVVIEDTNELALSHPHVVHLEAQIGRESPIGTADLVANALRMRPDRIIVGEVRTPREASALLDALSTGHDGSLTTAHAGSARAAIDRLELLLQRAGDAAPSSIRRHVESAFDLIVHVARRGSLRIVDEIATVEDGVLRYVHRIGPLEPPTLPARLRAA